MTLLLSDADVRSVLDYPTLVASVKRGLIEQGRGRAVVAPRQNLSFGQAFLRIMPCMYPAEGVVGYKAFQGSDTVGVRYVICLASIDDGEVLAYLDARHLTAARTGATSAVAAAALSPSTAQRIAVLGSGLEAETNLLAVLAVNPAPSVVVYSPNQERREAFARSMDESLAADVSAAADAMSACAEADIVIVATNTGASRAVAYRGEWMRPGQLVISIGATNPSLRELDEETFLRAERVVLDADPAQLLEECGDAIAMSETGRATLMRSVSLHELLSGSDETTVGDGPTLFKSVGSSLQDLVAAKVIYDAARQRGIGTEIGSVAETKIFNANQVQRQQDCEGK